MLLKTYLFHDHVEPTEYPSQEIANIYAVPDKVCAKRLLKLYLDIVQLSLPIDRSDLFKNQFDSFLGGEVTASGKEMASRVEFDIRRQH